MIKAFSLEGQVAVITGGGSGLGLGTAECLMAAGAKVVILGRREEVLKEACEKLGEGSAYYCYDVRDFDKAPDILNKIVKDHGKIDILVNNAGNHYKKFLEDLPLNEFQDILDTHLTGTFALSKAAIPHMRERKSGNIIFIASMTSYFGLPQVSAYSAAKSAILGLMRTIAVEYSVDGIRVNAVAPGFMDTKMCNNALNNDPDRKNRVFARTPMHKLGNPIDVGWAVTYLCSEAASFVNSATIVVDGGCVNGF